MSASIFAIVLVAALLHAVWNAMVKGGADKTAAPEASSRTVERDVEAPEVFQVTDGGLWDGRPSLGGVWVAHPDVKEPQRVLIRYDANGRFVIGALFRRERDNPGPRLLVSSDAADELGLLAGQPVRLNVTALKREEVKTDPPLAEPEADAGTEATEAEAEAEATEAVIQAAEAPVPVPEPVDDTVETASLDAELTVPAAEAPKKKTFWETLFPKKKDAGGPIDAMGDPDTVALPEAEAIEMASLDGGTIAAATPKPVSTLDKPYIQIGIFSVEQNARNAATSLRQDGILPTVKKQTSKGKTFWRVVVGPAMTSSDRGAIQKKVKALGYTDAYFVRS